MKELSEIGLASKDFNFLYADIKNPKQTNQQQKNPDLQDWREGLGKYCLSICIGSSVKLTSSF